MKSKQVTVARSKTVEGKQVSVIAYVDTDDGKLEQIVFATKAGGFSVGDHWRAQVARLLVLREPVQDEADEVGWNSVALFDPETVTHFERGSTKQWIVRKYKNK